MFLTTKTKATPRKNTKASSPGTAANSISPAFSPEFSSLRLSMRRSLKRTKSSSSSSESESEHSYAERMEQKWIERVKDEDVSYAWLWVA